MRRNGFERDVRINPKSINFTTTKITQLKNGSSAFMLSENKDFPPFFSLSYALFLIVNVAEFLIFIFIFIIIILSCAWKATNIIIIICI